MGLPRRVAHDWVAVADGALLVDHQEAEDDVVEDVSERARAVGDGLLQLGGVALQLGVAGLHHRTASAALLVALASAIELAGDRGGCTVVVEGAHPALEHLGGLLGGDGTPLPVGLGHWVPLAAWVPKATATRVWLMWRPLSCPP